MTHVTYQWTLEDILAAGAFASRKGSPLQLATQASGRSSGWVLMGALILLLAAPMTLPRHPGAGPQPWVVAALDFAIIIVAALVVTMVAKGTRARLYKHLAAAGALGPLPTTVDVDIFEPGLRFQSASSTTLIRWRALLNIEDDGKYVYFSHTGLLIYTVPKRAFPSAADSDYFLREAKRLWRAATLPAQPVPLTDLTAP